jgi:hypothetical protein
MGNLKLSKISSGCSLTIVDIQDMASQVFFALQFVVTIVLIGSQLLDLLLIMWSDGIDFSQRANSDFRVAYIIDGVCGNHDIKFESVGQPSDDSFHLFSQIGTEIDNNFPLGFTFFSDAQVLGNVLKQLDVLKMVVSVSIVEGDIRDHSPLVVPLEG